MYCIEVIKSKSYQAGREIRDNSNRGSSACFSEAGAVIHSGVFRSTCFISTDSPAYAPLRYWHKQEPAAFSAWVDQIVGDASVEGADEAACRTVRPGWTFNARKRKGFEFIQATRADGALVIHHSADSWRELHHVTK